MKERINRLAKGIVDMDIPELKLSQEAFDGVVTAGELNKGELVLSSGNGIHLKGLLYSDNPKVRVLKKAFGGLKTRIAFEIDAVNAKDADEIKGCFALVSNAGERRIPYSFCVRSYASAEIISTLKTPHDFARLFMDEESLALRVFDYTDFSRAPFMNHAKIRTIYEGLKASVDRRMALIEFLRALHAAPKLEERALHLAAPQAAAPQNGTGTEATQGEKEQPQEPAEQSAPAQEAEGAEAPVELHPELLSDVILLEEVATLYIREGNVSEEAFLVYQKAIENDSKITRLYEYYLYALPKDFSGRMPKEVYLYFSYENNINSNAKLPLYYNILQNFHPDSDIYQKFERDIQEYAIENLLRSRINDKLALLYDRMIYSDMVDGRIASVLPAILKSCRVSTKDSRMASVVVRYEELRMEDVFPLKNGAAYVPLFFENSVLLFQDAYGNRYTEVTYTKAPVMDKPQLEKRCFEVYPEHPMLKLAAARKIAKNGIQNAKQLRLVEDVLERMELNEPYANHLNRVILQYHDKFTRTNDAEISAYDLDYLKKMDLKKLDAQDKGMVLKTFIKLGAYEEAYQLVVCYGVTEPEPERSYMEQLLKHVVQAGGHEEDETLRMIAMHLFEQGSGDATLLKYLCESYNGLAEDMLRIQERSAALQLDCDDLTERLLAQMIFSRQNRSLDKVYAAYRALPQQESVLVNAYITQKSIDYFIAQEPVGSEVFEELYRMASETKDKDKLPVIHMLALSKYYAEQKSLKPEEKAVLAAFMPQLLAQKLVFAYTAKLADYIALPEEITDKVYIEYHGKRAEKPSLFVRIMPDEEEYREEEMPRVYQNIYVRSLVLFAGERAAYRVYDGAAETSAQGEVRAEAPLASAKGDTYDILNEMSALSGTGQEDKLKESMLKYVRNQSMVDALFSDIEESKL